MTRTTNEAVKYVNDRPGLHAIMTIRFPEPAAFVSLDRRDAVILSEEGLAEVISNETSPASWLVQARPVSTVRLTALGRRVVRALTK